MGSTIVTYFYLKAYSVSLGPCTEYRWGNRASCWNITSSLCFDL